MKPWRNNFGSPDPDEQMNDQDYDQGGPNQYFNEQA